MRLASDRSDKLLGDVPRRRAIWIFSLNRNFCLAMECTLALLRAGALRVEKEIVLHQTAVR